MHLTALPGAHLIDRQPPGRNLQRPAINPVVTTGLMGKQRIDILTQLSIIATRFSEESRPLLGRQFQCGPIDLTDLAIPFRCHHVHFGPIPATAMPEPDSNHCSPSAARL